MSKKNILQDITDAYAETQDIADTGRRLLALKKLDEKIKEKTKQPAKDQDTVEGGIVLGLMGVATTAVTLLTPAAWAWGWDVGIGAVTALITGASYIEHIGPEDTMLGGYLNSRRQNRANARYARDVVPHVPALKAIGVGVSKDISHILETDKVAELQQSKVLPKLLKAYPDLMKSFNQISEKKYTEAVTQDKNKKTKLEI